MKVFRKSYSKKNSGFTLIEILVVTVILGIMLGVAAQIFITILRNQNKTNLVSEIRQNAALVIDNFERDVRSAVSVETICPSGSTNASPLPCKLDPSAYPGFRGYDNSGLTDIGLKLTFRSGDVVWWECRTEDTGTLTNGTFLRGAGFLWSVPLTTSDNINGISVISCNITADNKDASILTLTFQVREGVRANQTLASKADLSQSTVTFSTTVGPRSK